MKIFVISIEDIFKLYVKQFVSMSIINNNIRNIDDIGQTFIGKYPDIDDIQYYINDFISNQQRENNNNIINFYFIDSKFSIQNVIVDNDRINIDLRKILSKMRKAFKFRVKNADFYHNSCQLVDNQFIENIKKEIGQSNVVTYNIAI